MMAFAAVACMVVHTFQLFLHHNDCFFLFYMQIINTKLAVMKYSLISTKSMTCNCSDHVIIGSSIVAYATVACTAPAAAL